MKRIFRLAIIILPIAIISSLVQAQENIEMCAQGWSSYQSGRYDQALGLYENCIKTGNLSQFNLARTYRNIGLIYSAKKDTEQAIANYDKALNLNPSDPWSDYVNRGNAWSTAGNYEKAIIDYEVALKLKPNFGEAYFNRGIVNEKLGNIEKAKADILYAYNNGVRHAQIVERMNYYKIPTGKSQDLDPNSPIESTEILSGALLQIISDAQGKLTCFEANVSLADIRPVVQEDLRQTGFSKPTYIQLAKAFYTLYPCPFSPNKPQLQLVSAKDLMGSWLFPENSQKFRFPPRSMVWQEPFVKSIKCEMIGFYPYGEMRTAFLSGTKIECGSLKASNAESMRQNPRVASWMLNNDGRLVVTRTDVPNHIEEWTMFVAIADFEARGLKVNKGDLIGYLRKERGNDLNIATTFRHLQRLPQ